MTEEEKIRYTDYLTILEELEKMKGAGVELFMEDDAASPEQIARVLTTSQENSYMRYFQADGSGSRHVLKKKNTDFGGVI